MNLKIKVSVPKMVLLTWFWNCNRINQALELFKKITFYRLPMGLLFTHA